MDGSLTTLPRVQAVPPVRNTSASSMQSPPASADATRVSILSPVFARPGASPRSRWLSTSSRRPRCWARVTGRSSPALATGGHRRRFECGRGAQVAASIGCSLFLAGFLFQTIIPEVREHLLAASGHCPDALLRWIRAKWGTIANSIPLRWRLPYAAGSYHVQRGGRTISTRFQMDSASSTRAVGT